MSKKIKWGVIGSGGIARRRTIPEGIVASEITELVSVYDVIAEVVFKGGMQELYRLTSVEIPKIGNVTSEAFVIIKSRGKWIHLPKGMEAL